MIDRTAQPGGGGRAEPHARARSVGAREAGAVCRARRALRGPALLVAVERGGRRHAGRERRRRRARRHDRPRAVVAAVRAARPAGRHEGRSPAGRRGVRAGAVVRAAEPAAGAGGRAVALRRRRRGDAHRRPGSPERLALARAGRADARQHGQLHRHREPDGGRARRGRRLRRRTSRACATTWRASRSASTWPPAPPERRV